jgi:hypothetical protein
VQKSAIVGRTESDLLPAPMAVWDNGPALRVSISGGELASASRLSVLNGANVMAIGDGAIDGWEIFQFQTADLVAPDTYELSGRLRGINGTEGFAATVWPAGSVVVMLDGALSKLEIDAALRGLSMHYLYGPAKRAYDDATYRKQEWATDGVALKPYAPVHIRAAWSEGALACTWMRRSRVDADTWASFEVPLGEARELYRLRVRNGAALRTEIMVETAAHVFSAPEVAALGIGPDDTLEIAQISERFGVGTPGARQIA